MDTVLRRANGASDGGQLKPTVLIVEDEIAVRGLIGLALCKLGFNVILAAGVDEAMRLARDSRAVDLLVTDYSMPGMNGLELTRWFNACFPYTPVLIATAASDLVNAAAGPHDHFELLRKPFTPDELVARIRRALAPGT
jgi:DNA-binding response OmpR family regulator